jgi:multidrug resistance protein, MATE family
LGQHLRATRKLALPLVFAQLATFTMGLVDTACVGHFSSKAMAAVGVGNAIHWAMACIGTGVGLGLDPFVSQAVGAGNHDEARDWWREGCILALWVTLPLVLSELIIASVLPAMGVSQEISDGAFSYLIFRAPAQVFFQLFLVHRAYLQAYEITRPIMLATVVANGVNLVCDLLLVFGDRSLLRLGLPAVGLPALGAKGAGITTMVSSGVLAAMVYMALRRVAAQHAPRPSIKKTTSRLKLMGVAAPVALQQVAESWLFCVFGVLVGRFGSVAVASHQTALVLSATAFMFAVGMASATAVRVGHAVGMASRPAVLRSAAAGVIWVLGLMSVTAGAFLLVPEFLVGLISDQAAVRAMSAPLLRYSAAFALFDGIQAVMAGALRGAGDVRIPSLICFGCYWGLGAPVGYWAMTTRQHVSGVWLGFCVGLIAAAFALTWRFVRTTSKRIEPITAGDS